MKITLGVTGGIAAYKAAELVRALQAKAFDVRVVMTEGAQQFIRPLTFEALTGHRVAISLWDAPVTEGETDRVSAMEHIELGQWCDALVIAPATADALARFAQGRADDLLSTIYLATTAPVVIAPAMNVNMWNHPATQANVALLRERGAIIVEPEVGELACGVVGSGRLAELGTIVEATMGVLHYSRDLAGQTMLITAGGTREALDPVRFLGNRSSGKMGYALAQAAQRRGARVILVSAPTALQPPTGCEVLRVTTAQQMRDVVFARMGEANALIMSAAVADYRPRAVAPQKMKRTGPLTVEFEPTEDILAQVVERRQPGLLVVGFAAETENALDHGRAKLLKKGADAIVLNDVSRPGIGFDSDRNAATFLTATTASDLPEMPKRELADRILSEMLQLRRPQRVMSEGSARSTAPAVQ